MRKIHTHTNSHALSVYNPTAVVRTPVNQSVMTVNVLKNISITLISVVLPGNFYLKTYIGLQQLICTTLPKPVYGNEENTYRTQTSNKQL